MVDRRLGRGLDFFLSRESRGKEEGAPAPEGARKPDGAEAGQGDGLMTLDVDQLIPNPDQPREEMTKEHLDELAASIRSAGILQPILARRSGEKFQIVAGERRWRAARRAGLEQVPVLVREMTDEQSAVFALVENVQRTDLNALEKARAFRSLQAKLECSQEELSRQVGLERSTVTNFLRLLELPESVQAHVSRGTLSMGHARALLALPADALEAIADRVIRDRLSVRQVEELVKQAKAGPSESTGGGAATAKDAKGRPVWLNEIEENLVEALGTSVAVKYGRKRSKITIECAGRDEFERVYEMLKNLGGGADRKSVV